MRASPPSSPLARPAPVTRALPLALRLLANCPFALRSLALCAIALVSSVALAQEGAQESTPDDSGGFHLGVTGELNIFGAATTLGGIYAPNRWFGYGARVLRGRTLKMHQTAYNLAAAVHPFGGSFYVEVGLGYADYLTIDKDEDNDGNFDETDGDSDLDSWQGVRRGDFDDDGKPDDEKGGTLGYHARLGNRWVFPFGLTLGVTYVGLSSTGLLLVGGEVGWRF